MIIRYAKVTDTSEGEIKVTFLGETEQSSMVYHKLRHIIPQLGDMVAILEDSKGKKLIIGVM